MEPTQAATAAANGAVHLVDKCAAYQNFVGRAFCQGGNNMFIILAIGLLVVYLIANRLFALSRLTVDKANITENLFTMILRGDIRQAIAFCDSRPTPLTNTLKAGLVQTMNRRPDEEIQVAMDASVLRETPNLEGWVSFLAVFGNVGVLVGLMGTIIGLITSFGGVAEADAATKAARLVDGYFGSPEQHRLRFDRGDHLGRGLRVLAGAHRPRGQRHARDQHDPDEFGLRQPGKNKGLNDGPN